MGQGTRTVLGLLNLPDNNVMPFLKVATTMFQLKMYSLGFSIADDGVNICLEFVSIIIYHDLVKTCVQF